MSVEECVMCHIMCCVMCHVMCRIMCCIMCCVICHIMCHIMCLVMCGIMCRDAGCNTLGDLIFLRTVNIPNLSLLPWLEVAYDA